MKLESEKYGYFISPCRKRFLVSSVILFVVAIVSVYQVRNKRLLENTYKELLRADNGLYRLKQASKNYKQTLDALKIQLDKGGNSVSTARIVYGKADEIGTLYKPDEMTIGALEKKGSDISLSYTLKFIDMDYNRFLTIVSELQGGTFPVSHVVSIAIAQSTLQGKGSVIYTISGSITAIEKSQP